MSQLPRFNLYISIACLVSLIMINIYPIINIIYSSKFIENNRLNLQELGNMYITNNDFSSYYAAHYIALNYRGSINGAIPLFIYTRV